MFPQFDPSKMDPKLMMEISQLVRQLPPDQVVRLQGIMHNMMAGFDVRKDMEEFEKTLPPGFREKMMGLMASQPEMVNPVDVPSTISPSEEMNLREARLTLLRAVADGNLSPEEAEKLLFPG